jgi:hypothetical protein
MSDPHLGFKPNREKPTAPRVHDLYHFFIARVRMLSLSQRHLRRLVFPRWILPQTVGEIRKKCERWPSAAGKTNLTADIADTRG